MYVKYSFLLSIAFFLNIKLYSQKNFIIYDQVKVENISSIEESFNSRVYESKMESVESANDSIIRYGKLKNYERPKNKYFGKVDVVYYYLKSDVLVRRISYFWVKPDNAKLKDYSKQFDKTVKKISEDLNLPVGDQGKLTKVIDETIEGVPTEIKERRVTWKYNSAKILVIMVWSEKHGASLHTQIEW